MKNVLVQLTVAALIVAGIGLSVANSLDTFHEYEIPGGVWGLLDLVSPLPMFLCAALIAAITAGNLGARYFKWMVLLRAGHIMAPSRKLFFSFLASFIGNLTPFYILYALRIAPLREKFMLALLLLGVDLATDVLAILLIAYAASYSLLGAAALVFVLGAFALALFPTKSKDRKIGFVPMLTSLIFAQSFSILIWSATAMSLWVTLLLFDVRVAIPEALQVYAASHAEGITSITLPGFLRVGRSMITMLIELGVTTETAVFAAALVRVFTYWLVILAALWSLFQIRRQFGRKNLPANHFDEIAEEYQGNIPEHIRLRLLNRKIELNLDHLPSDQYLRGIDAGCGQGWYLKEMLSRGYDVEGIDFSENQIQQARRYLGESNG
ncbi:MAG: methyltransferase domain-containing protein, partial [Leptospirales bacterium]